MSLTLGIHAQRGQASTTDTITALKGLGTTQQHVRLVEFDSSLQKNSFRSLDAAKMAAAVLMMPQM